MTDNAAHLLIVDDDARLRDLLKKFLSDNGYTVTVAKDAGDARKKLEMFAFDGIVLDIMMPGETGLELAQTLNTRQMPILLLSALGEAHHRISGLETGVQDYLTKPFEPRELVLRVQNMLRTAEQQKRQDDSVTVGNYRYRASLQALYKGDEEVHLTTTERALLAVLMSSPGMAVSRETLAGAGSVSERSVDVQINRLRKKLDGESKSSVIRTVRGAGYAIYPS